MKLSKKHSGRDLTIFSEMSALANKHHAVNLAQGFPDNEIDIRLKNFLAQATLENHNQYTPLQGDPLLVENLSIFNKNRKLPILIDKENITIIPGATYGIYCALKTIIDFGDEVIVFEPCYDSYVPSIEMNGGIPVFVQLDNDFELNWDHFENAITEKTKAVIVNSPHNPTGKVWTKESLEKLYSYIKDKDIIVISDEVYDLLIYDDLELMSVFHHPELRKRSICIYSFGKMFHATGWKIGYIFAEEELSMAFRQVHQYMTFCVNSPSQRALAKYLEVFDVVENKRIMQNKRDLFFDLMQETPFIINEKANGSYFQLGKFTNIKPKMTDKEFAIWLTVEKKVALIPTSAFFHNEKNTGTVRFCFAKKEETIIKAVENLRNL
ncbi:methionine aminotransferase [Frigoriflavimonas asaccharolytica]|uniref:Methionine aminotransferase n=1 Tax=Frigoriflavimonas asaccharolytica TaxID=2735899 RepID=A0A8J8G587_9FLAO|nr:methionine aminotransferase [Frigoriflavimonas asaccharolytica]NRS91511.1 methionine aminotransferase [Frigoriflavimonas asaccharolytica]